MCYDIVCSEDEDDTAELLAELQRIRKERAQEEARKVDVCGLRCASKVAVLAYAGSGVEVMFWGSYLDLTVKNSVMLSVFVISMYIH